MAQSIKNPAAIWETWVRSLVGKIRWGRAWQSTSVFLPGESHGQRGLAGCRPRGHEESDTTERLSPAQPSRSVSYHIVQVNCNFKVKMGLLEENVIPSNEVWWQATELPSADLGSLGVSLLPGPAPLSFCPVSLPRGLSPSPADHSLFLRGYPLHPIVFQGSLLGDRY